MTSTPPFAEYPRGQNSEAANQLEAAYAAYKASGRAFLYLIAASLGLGLGLGFLSATINQPDVILFIYVLIPIVSFFLLGETFRQLKIAKGWDDGKKTGMQILYAVLTGVCCGIFGFIFLQQIATGVIRSFGLKIGFFGVKKDEVEAKIQELRQGPGMPKTF